MSSGRLPRRRRDGSFGHRTRRCCLRYRPHYWWLSLGIFTLDGGRHRRRVRTPEARSLPTSATVARGRESRSVRRSGRGFSCSVQGGTAHKKSSIVSMSRSGSHGFSRNAAQQLRASRPTSSGTAVTMDDGNGPRALVGLEAAKHLGAGPSWASRSRARMRVGSRGEGHRDTRTVPSCGWASAPKPWNSQVGAVRGHAPRRRRPDPRGRAASEHRVGARTRRVTGDP